MCINCTTLTCWVVDEVTSSNEIQYHNVAWRSKNCTTLMIRCWIVDEVASSIENQWYIVWYVNRTTPTPNPSPTTLSDHRCGYHGTTSGGSRGGSMGSMEPPFLQTTWGSAGPWHCVFSRNISDLILKRSVSVSYSSSWANSNYQL